MFGKFANGFCTSGLVCFLVLIVLAGGVEHSRSLDTWQVKAFITSMIAMAICLIGMVTCQCLDIKNAHGRQTDERKEK